MTSPAENPYPHTALPPGAVEDDGGWVDAHRPKDAFRIVLGPKYFAGGNHVQAVGTQRPDGSLEDAFVRTTHHMDDEISAGDARAAAEGFLKAAADVERWEAMWSL